MTKVKDTIKQAFSTAGKVTKPAFQHMKKAAEFAKTLIASAEVRKLMIRRLTESPAVKPYIKWHRHMRDTSYKTGMGIVIPLFLCAIMITGGFVYRVYSENNRLTKEVYVLSSQVQNYSSITTEQSKILDDLKDFEANAGQRISDFTEKYKSITETYFETRLGSQLSSRATGDPGQNFVKDIGELQQMLNSLESLNSNTSDKDLKFDDLQGRLKNYIDAIPTYWPTPGSVTSFFGNRYTPFDYSYITHKGVDIPGSYGQAISASASGVVVSASWEGGYGLSVVIDHLNGITTRYAHNSELLVTPGQMVTKGETIALMGSTGDSTGNHCHFEIYVNGSAVDPLSFLQ